jgi:hypothetical protein
MNGRSFTKALFRTKIGALREKTYGEMAEIMGVIHAKAEHGSKDLY